MIILDATTKSLQIKLAGAITTNQLSFAASYVDTTGTATTPGEQDGASNNTTAVTVVGAPASSTQRLVKNIIIQNADTVAATVTVIYNNNSTLRNIVVVTLAAGDQLVYEDGYGWASVDKNGNLKTSSSGGSTLVTSVSNSDGTLSISPPTGTVIASLAALSSGHLLVGNASNVATGVSMSGDATLSNTGAVTVSKTGGTSFGSLATLNSVNNSNWSGTALSAANGGTGNTSLTAHSVLLGEGTSGVGFATTGTAGQLLIDQGSGADPSFNAMSGDATITSGGVFTVANNAITNAKAAKMAANTIKGNNTGSTANASDLTVAQVLAMLNITSPVAYNSIAGCLLSSISGTHTTATISVSAGQAADSTNSVYITSAGYSWAASNGNAINGTDAASSTLANSTTYHMFLCSGGSGTVTFCSASLTPTFPTGYTTYSRRIGSFNTNASGAPLPYTSIESEGGSVINWLATQALDLSVSNVPSSPRTLYTLASVPTGIKVIPYYRFTDISSTNAATFIVTSGDETDVAPTAYNGTTVPLFTGQYAGSTTGQTVALPSDGVITTNTSGQIGVRSNSSSQNMYWVTRGWKDFRRS